MRGILPKEFVSTFGSQHLHGVYTVIPTIIQNEEYKLLDLEYHQERLMSSLETLLSLHNHPLDCSLDGINSMIRDCIKQDDSIVDSYGITTICLGVDALSNSLIAKNMFSTNDGCNYHSMYQKYNENNDETSFVVNTCVYERTLPQVKSCSWPIDRIPLEANRLRDYSETIICSAAHNDLVLKEGLVSNLFFIRENKLLTSSYPVLSGSMAKLVIQIAQQNGFTVEYTELSSAILQSNYAQGAFLTSATKPMQRISGIVDLKGNTIFDSSKSGADASNSTTRLRKLLLYSLIHDKSLWTLL